MALPVSRNTTYAAGSQVKSADLNDLQDWIVDAFGDQVLAIPAAAGAVFTGAWAPGFINSAGMRNTSPSVGDAVILPIVLRKDDRLKRVGVRVNDGSSSALRLKVYVQDQTNGGITQLGSNQDSAGTGANQELVVDLTGGSERTLGADEQFFLTVENLAATGVHDFFGAAVTYDRPA